MGKKIILFMALLVVFTTLLKSFVIKATPEVHPKQKKEEEKVVKATELKKLETQMMQMQIKLQAAVLEKKRSAPKKNANKQSVKTGIKAHAKAAASAAQATVEKKNEGASKSVARKVVVEKRHVTAGARIMSETKHLVPVIELDYDAIGSSRYFATMKELGGAVFVGNPSAKTLLAEATINTEGSVYFGGFKEGEPETAGLAMSRPHELVDEPLVEDILSDAINRFGQVDLTVVVLLTEQSEEGFIGGIEDAIKGAGYGIEDFSSFQGYYSGARSISIKSGVLKDGRKVELNIQLDLSGLV